MPEEELRVRLEVMDSQPGRFMLVSGAWRYPVSLNAEGNAFSDLLRRLQGVMAGQGDSAGLLSSQELMRKVGMWLWEALLPEDGSGEEREGLARALRGGRSAVLLEMPEGLVGLPWELLCDPEQTEEKGFVGRRRPLMRFDAEKDSMASIAPPLRVLVLISSPPGLGEDSRVDVESERAAVEIAVREMREAGLLQMVVEDIVTRTRVQGWLTRFKPHIVHYIGHGGYDEARGGVLLWEDEQGNEAPIFDEQLAGLLRPRNLYAVLLHACETGRRNARTDVRGVAGTLVQEGIPTVVAQQANFTYESSQRASTAWYTALTAGQSFAEALFEVRQALTLAERPDWAVPVLLGSASSLVPVLDASADASAPDPLLNNAGVADLPTPTGIFVGRHSELRALRLMLENAPGSGAVMALVTGPGGVGKSTLVTQAVMRYAGKYKAVLTLRCQGYQGVELFLQRIGEFLKQLGASGFLEQWLPDPKLSTEAKIEQAIVALNQAGPLLLVVDNLESVQGEDQTVRDAALLYLLQKLLTNLRTGRVLITGRYEVKDLRPEGKFAAHLLRLEMSDLSRYETGQLLLRHPALARLGETVRRTLINEFGGLPYVYDLLGSDAASYSPERLIHDVQKRITEERRQRSAREWQEVRQRVIEFAALKEVVLERLPEMSRVLLKQLAVLRRPFPLEAIEQGLGAERVVWQQLLNWSLMHFDAQEQTYYLHSLTRRYVEEDLQEEEARREAQIRLSDWYERYAKQSSHKLADYLEAHRLLRAAGRVQQAGKIVLGLAEPLRRFGLYPLLSSLCEGTLNDIGESDELLKASALDELGKIAHLQGDYEQARSLCLQSLVIFERSGDPSGKARSLHQLGIIAQDQGESAEARSLYLQSLALEERLGDQNGKAASLHQLGIIAQRQGEYVEARSLHQQSLAIKERSGDLSGKALSLHQLGIIAQDQGEYDQARSLYQQSLVISERLGDQNGKALSLHHLGTIAQDQGEYVEARSLYLQSLVIFERLGNQNGKAASLHQLGMIAQRQGEYVEARSLYQQSLVIFERLGDLSGKATSLHQLGMIAQDQGEYVEARSLYQQSLALKEQLGDLSGKAASLHQLGNLAYEQGDLEKALQYIVQAYIIFEALRSPSLAIAQRMIARIRSEIGETAFIAQWQALAGDHPLPTLSTQDRRQFLLELVIDFMKVPTWDESKHFLEMHPRLLQPEMDTLLQKLATQEEDNDNREFFEGFRVLLGECRDKGIEAAFAKYQRQEEEDIDDKGEG